MNIKISDIIEAKKRLSEVVKTTPLEYSKRLSDKFWAEIYLKREDLQVVRSYKIRWALNFLKSLTSEEIEIWVVAASAGNHSQGVALACSELNVPWVIFMPITTSEQKVYKTKKFGWDNVEIKLVWDTYDDAKNAAKNFCKKSKKLFVDPFDDERVIAGQATVTYEILTQMDENPDFIISPIWWWGLISWVIIVTEQKSPKTKVLGAVAEHADAMKKSLEVWENIELSEVDTFSDWSAMKKVGQSTFEICKEYGLEVLSVPEWQLAVELLDFLREEGMVVEPSWALSVWALSYMRKEELSGKKIVCIISGGNFDFERLPEVKERSLKFRWLKKYIIVRFPQRPGALKEFLNFLWEYDDITRFEYLKKTNKEKAPALIWIQTNDSENFIQFFNNLEKNWIKYEDITNNDLYFDLLI